LTIDENSSSVPENKVLAMPERKILLTV